MKRNLLVAAIGLASLALSTGSPSAAAPACAGTVEGGATQSCEFVFDGNAIGVFVGAAGLGYGYECNDGCAHSFHGLGASLTVTDHLGNVVHEEPNYLFGGGVYLKNVEPGTLLTCTATGAYADERPFVTQAGTAAFSCSSQTVATIG